MNHRLLGEQYKAVVGFATPCTLDQFVTFYAVQE